MSVVPREISRKDWSFDCGVTAETIRLGCLQRIADATEVMAKNFLALQAEVRWEKERRQRAEADAKRMAHVIRGLRGALTKARRKARGVA